MVEFIPQEMAEQLHYPRYLAEAILQAHQSQCLVRRVGAVVVLPQFPDDIYLGKGANMPPLYERPEHCNKTCIPKLGGPNDRHCCVHAEEDALTEAIRCGHFGKLKDATLVFADINVKGRFVPSASRPYCTQCSKRALRLNVKYWVCYHDKGVWPESEGYYRYTAQEYNTLSYAYRATMVDTLGEIVDALKGWVFTFTGDIKKMAFLGEAIDDVVRDINNIYHGLTKGGT
jgi:hypothetical protein